MRIIFISVLFLCSVFVNAQKDKATDQPELFVTISMNKMPLAEFPENVMRVSNISIMQSVSDSLRMGYTVKGKWAAVATLKFAKPLSEILQTQVKRMYKHEYKKEGVEFLWVIKQLRFAHKATYSYTRFNADGYISQGGNMFRKACTLDTVLVLINRGGHGVDLENAFRVLLRKTFKGAADSAGAVSYNMEQIAPLSKPDLDIPILKADTYNEGLYTNFTEFLQNKPSVKEYEQLEGEKKRIEIRLKHDVPGNKKINVWGLCKNGKIYKYHDSLLIELKKESPGFVIEGYVEEANWRNKKNMEISYVASAASAASPLLSIPFLFYKRYPKLLLVETIPNIEDPRARPDATCIDMRTGEFTF